jgi:hypothetical protein
MVDTSPLFLKMGIKAWTGDIAYIRIRGGWDNAPTERFFRSSTQE